MCQSTGYGQSQNDHALHWNSVSVQVIVQGAVLVVLWHQPELSPGAIICRINQMTQLYKDIYLRNVIRTWWNQVCWAGTFVVSSNESQDVLMPEHDGLINLCFPEPRPLVPGGEDLHGHVLPSPLPSPHLTEPTFSDGLLQDDGSSDGSLDQQWKSCDTQSVLVFKKRKCFEK